MTPEFLLVAVAVPVLIVGLLTLPFVDVGVNLADEGYLLLGSNAVLDGQVPIRDFRAYDPGRYYWCALWLKFLGRKYSTLRLAMAFIMFCSLSLSAMTIYLATADMLICVVVCLLCSNASSNRGKVEPTAEGLHRLLPPFMSKARVM